jgi:hypothetical protein
VIMENKKIIKRIIADADGEITTNEVNLKG